jgi:hypothetical protein
MFRKFVDDDEEPVEEQDNFISTSALRGPRTRSSLKPRLLFTEEKREPTTTDEEADTDIEDANISSITPSHSTKISTPKAPKFAPASPPTTIRATRSKIVDVEMDRSPGGGPATPRGRGGRGKSSPFDLWQRSRSESSSRKREASGGLERGGEKRARI